MRVTGGALIPPIPSTVTAAILIGARKILAGLDVEPTSAEEICTTLGVSRSQAYAMLPRLWELAPTLLREPGRSPRPATSTDARLEVAQATVGFLMDHPGAVEGSGKRRSYHPPFRLFVLSLMEEGRPGSRVSLAELADAVRIPLPTLKSWLRDPGAVVGSPPEATERATRLDEEELPKLEVHIPGLAVVLREWRRWKGGFSAFCRHLRENHDIRFGDTYIGTVLHLAGLRRRAPRKSPATPWSRGTFETMFPGAQWVGDGKQVVVEWQGEPFVFNVEAVVDPASGALMAFRVTDAEDEEAVLAAYAEGKETGGGPPLGFTLDNRPSNHTEGVQETVEEEGTRLLRSTPGRGQSKAPVEGAFGLFSQQMPELAGGGETPREQARSALQLAVTSYARGRNGKPRKKLGGRTPAEAYQQARPTPEEVEAAKEHLAELERRQAQARRTRASKADPVRRHLLVEELAALDIEDPGGELATELARYCLEAILRGIATFRAKRDLDTLPPGADPGRYLAGIIRNIDGDLEDALFADHLLDLRVRAGELSLEILEREGQELADNKAPCELPALTLYKALDAVSLLDFRFWVERLREALGGLDPPRLRRASENWLVRTVLERRHLRRTRRRILLAAITEGHVATKLGLPHPGRRPAPGVGPPRKV